MNLALKLLLKYQSQKNNKLRQKADGFTMIELLIGTIMAFLIITPLLGFVVSVLNDDVREQAKSETDFEQQAAVSFISEDLGQAYYIYSDAKELDDGVVDEITAIQGDLPNVDGGTPILVFWKQQTIPNALPIDTNDVPKDCEPNTCDDTTVRALVAYYLVQEQDNNSIWCQPGGGDCPQRIVRYVIKEAVEKYRGTGVYYQNGELKDSQQETDGFNPNFDLDNPTENVTEGNVTAQPQVLINYVADFEVSDVPATSDSATIVIQSDGRRRIDGGQSCVDDDGEIESSAFCPKATVTIQGYSLELN